MVTEVVVGVVKLVELEVSLTGRILSISPDRSLNAFETRAMCLRVSA